MLKIDGIKNSSLNFASTRMKHAEKTAEPENPAVRFGAKAEANEETEEKKKGISAKKLTNILGVAMWIAIAAIGMHKTKLWDCMTRKTPEVISNVSGRMSDRVGNAIKTLGKPNAKKQAFEAIDAGEGSKISKMLKKGLYRMGNFASSAQDLLGSELYNNLTYAFGTLVVMPLVIWFSPIGKKDSTWEDNFTASIRQPFSVFSTLTMQLVFDKLVDKYTDKAIKKNALENDAVKASVVNGEIGVEAFDQIKYNSSEAKRLFQILPNVDREKGGLKGLISEAQAKKIFELDPLADAKEGQSYIDNLERLIKNSEFSNLAEPELNILRKKLGVFAQSLGYNKLAKQKPKVANNVIVSSIIGCTFLNVIYGKFMKSWHEHRDAKAAQKLEAENQMKEVA